jgi:hypothetical protein
MEQTTALPRILILQLLELIEQSDKNITHLLQTGSTERSFAVKQEKHLLEKYCKELSEIMEQNYHEVEVKVLFKTAKAA